MWERVYIDGWGQSTDVPNPCKLSGLMERVQLQGELFIRMRKTVPYVSCLCVGVEKVGVFFFVCVSCLHVGSICVTERLRSIASDARSNS